jgi:uncharacterized protein YjbI with pentapeptide repeats
MSDGTPCGRAIHPAPEQDKVPVCLMHSVDPTKSNLEFQAEFEQILKSTPVLGGKADFTGFIFPESNYAERTFAPDCSFLNAVFLQKANFGRTSFNGTTDFVHCLFEKQADFSQVKFRETAHFSASWFAMDADFTWANFMSDALFLNASFQSKVVFYGCTFGQLANFWHATFAGIAEFQEAHVQGPLRFLETYFERDLTSAPCLRFSEVELANPKQVVFYRTNLTHALFYNTNISEVVFSLVVWGSRNYHSHKTRWRSLSWAADLRPDRACLFEEVVDTSFYRESELGPTTNNPDERNYGLFAEMYQQLKRNYDTKGDYWMAGNWHYGEMEMKRLHSRWRLRPLRWLSQHFSLVALYKYASAYGESYTMPLIWLGLVLVGFALMYPVLGCYPATGLMLNSQDAVYTKDTAQNYINYWNYAAFFAAHPLEHPSGWLGMMLHSFMTSISVAGFQKELRYMPSYPWGRMMALVELLLTSTFGGLFALAIRRQFKRS